MVNHHQMCFPVYTGYTKKIIELQIFIMAELLCKWQPVFCIHRNIKPFLGFVKNGGSKQFSYFGFQLLFIHVHSLPVLICSLVIPALIFSCKLMSACNNAS